MSETVHSVLNITGPVDDLLEFRRIMGSGQDGVMNFFPPWMPGSAQSIMAQSLREKYWDTPHDFHIYGDSEHNDTTDTPSELIYTFELPYKPAGQWLRWLSWLAPRCVFTDKYYSRSHDADAPGRWFGIRVLEDGVTLAAKNDDPAKTEYSDFDGVSDYDFEITRRTPSNADFKRSHRERGRILGSRARRVQLCQRCNRPADEHIGKRCLFSHDPVQLQGRVWVVWWNRPEWFQKK